MTVPGRGGTVAVVGAAAGIGAATARRLAADGNRVITVDVRAADVTCDLGTDAGRRDAVARVTRLASGVLDGLVQAPSAGGRHSQVGALAVSMNYFGSVAVLEGLLTGHRDRDHGATTEPPESEMAIGDEGAQRDSVAGGGSLPVATSCRLR